MRRECLPDAEIDRLFTRLLVRYGAPFSDRWRMVDLKVVKADWARELGRFAQRPDAIAWALERLPERVPSVIDFAHLCDQAPRHDAAPARPKTRGPNPFEREQLRALREVCRVGLVGERPSRAWVERLAERVRRGEHRPTPLALAMARDAAAGAASAAEAAMRMPTPELGQEVEPASPAMSDEEEASWF